MYRVVYVATDADTSFTEAFVQSLGSNILWTAIGVFVSLARRVHTMRAARAPVHRLTLPSLPSYEPVPRLAPESAHIPRPCHCDQYHDERNVQETMDSRSFQRAQPVSRVCGCQCEGVAVRSNAAQVRRALCLPNALWLWCSPLCACVRPPAGCRTCMKLGVRPAVPVRG